MSSGNQEEIPEQIPQELTGERAKELWRLLIGPLTKSVGLEVSDWPSLVGYCNIKSRLEAVQLEVEQNPKVRDPKSGYLVNNPLMKTISELSKTESALAASLGIGPKNRATIVAARKTIEAKSAMIQRRANEVKETNAPLQLARQK